MAKPVRRAFRREQSPLARRSRGLSSAAKKEGEPATAPVINLDDSTDAQVKLIGYSKKDEASGKTRIMLQEIISVVREAEGVRSKLKLWVLTRS